MASRGYGRLSPMNHKLTAGVLGILGATCLLLVQFLSWGGVSQEGGQVFGFSFPDSEVEAHTWHMEARAGNNEHKESWYSDEMEDDGEDQEGLSEIRIAIPFLLGGLIVTALGAVLALAARGGAGSIVLLVGGLVAAAGTTLFILGVDQMFDSAQDWSSAYYLAIAGCVLAVLGGVLGLVGQNRRAA
jgi:hypothetical protein